MGECRKASGGCCRRKDMAHFLPPSEPAFMGNRAALDRLIDLCEPPLDGDVSPRLSFSQDLAMASTPPSSSSSSSSSSSTGCSSRLSAEKRKWVEQQLVDDDFEFSRTLACGAARHVMLSADELFFDGKLLPLGKAIYIHDDLYLHSRYPDNTLYYDRCPPLQDATVLSLQKCTRPIARHLSLDNLSLVNSEFCVPRPDPVSSYSTPSAYYIVDGISAAAISSTATPHRHHHHHHHHRAMSTHVHTASSSNSSGSSTATSTPLPSTSSTSSSSSSPSRYSRTFKAFFKFKKDVIPVVKEPCRHNSSSTSACRLPLSPRSLCPFSGNGTEEDNGPSSCFPCPNVPSGEISSLEITIPRGFDCRDVETSCDRFNVKAPFNVGVDRVCKDRSATEEKLGGSCGTSGSLEHGGRFPKEERANTSASSTNIPTVGKTMQIRFLGNALKKKSAVLSGDAGQGSPAGRRATTVNSSMIVLKNLERCTAEKKLLRDKDNPSRQMEKRPIAATTRVSPMLNVSIYRQGNTTKDGLLGCFLAAKKELKPREGTVNWRMGS